MLEIMLISLCAGMICWGVYTISDAFAGGVGGYRDPNKWAVNPSVMRWLIPIIVVGIVAYGFYLKHLGLI